MKTPGFNILLFLSYSLFINTASFASPVEKSGFKLSYYNLEVKSDTLTEITTDKLKMYSSEAIFSKEKNIIEL